MKTITLNPDAVGMMASTLCLIHCIATPFLFLAKTCSVTAACCADAPIWWQIIDYLFIVVSFMAIYFATKNTSKSWIKTALWSAWGILLFAILNETIQTNLLPAAFVYVPALSIVALHLYNQKYCQCAADSCCVE